jgi:hypothetical protein
MHPSVAGAHDHDALYDALGSAAAAQTAAQNFATGLVNDLSGVDNPSVARTNLGLGSAATTASTAYDPAGSAASAQSAAIAAAAALVDDLSGVSDAATARTNLGLGSAATTASTAYDPAGSAASAQAAAEATAAAANTADIAAHAGAADPHGDRAYAAGLVAPLTATSDRLKGMSASAYGLKRWRVSTRALRHIVCFGDSMVQGGGISGKTEGWPDMLRRAMRSELGVPIHEGFQPIFWASTTPAYRWAKSTGWTNQAATASNLSPTGMSNTVLRTTNGSSRTLTWTRPANVSVSRIVVWWVDDSTTSTGGWSYSTDGGTAWTTVTPTAPGTPTLKSTTVSGLSDPATFIIRNANAAGTLYATPVFIGIDVYGPTPDSGWVVHNVGYTGAALATSGVGCVATDRSGDFGAMFDAWAPELVIWSVSNDSTTSGYNLPAFQTATSTFLARVGTYADVIAWGFPEQTDFNRPYANQTAIRNHYMSATVAAGGGAIDQSARWGTITQAINSGLMEAAGFPIHPNNTGDLDIAATVARYLRVFA